MSSKGSISPRIALSLRVQNSWRRFDQTSDIRSQNSALRWTDQSTEARGEDIGEAFEGTAQVCTEDLNRASGRWAELRGDGPLSLDMEHVWQEGAQTAVLRRGGARRCLDFPAQRYNLWNLRPPESIWLQHPFEIRIAATICARVWPAGTSTNCRAMRFGGMSLLTCFFCVMETFAHTVHDSSQQFAPEGQLSSHEQEKQRLDYSCADLADARIAFSSRDRRSSSSTRHLHTQT